MESNAPYRSLRQGEMLNWYRIERILGRGGFGVIYLATDTNLDYQVAIKEYRVLVPSSSEVTGAKTADLREHANDGLQRFIAEARNLVRFNHPNIVRVMSVFELNDTAYMVMEFEEGQDLRQHLVLPANASEAALKHLFVPISLGLAEVHKHGFVHRDIKPANILVRNVDGSPVLLDFGSARCAGPANSVTMTALVSVGYSPLEQYSHGSDRQQGPWTDIYALGGVLYYAVSGVEPVDSAKRGSAILNGGKDPLLPARMLGRGRYSDQFLSAIDWALSFRIADRPQSLDEWMPILLRSSSKDEVTRLVGEVSKGKTSSGHNPLNGLSMRDQPVPREVEAARVRRGDVPNEVKANKGQGLLLGALLLVGVVLIGIQLPALFSGDSAQTGSESPSESSRREAASDLLGANTTKQAEEEEARKVAEAAAKALAASEAQLAKEREIAEAAKREEEENAKQAEALLAERERAKQLALEEAQRQSRLRARQEKLRTVVTSVRTALDRGQLDTAEALLDEGATLERNNSTLKALRARWRNALIDASTPVSDTDFDEVITRFDKLKRALQSNDAEAMDALTIESDQNVLFRQLMSGFATLDISIEGIQVRNADKSILAKLRIENMVRSNGDRATPSPAYRSRTITSRRIEGEWSLIHW